jgi:hypothetical protein
MRKRDLCVDAVMGALILTNKMTSGAGPLVLIHRLDSLFFLRFYNAFKNTCSVTFGGIFEVNLF